MSKRDSEFFEFVARTAIVAMVSDDRLMHRLVLKGGNAISIFHDNGARASLDVDFSIPDKQSDFALLEGRIKSALEREFAEHGLRVFDFEMSEVPQPVTDDLKDFWGGFEISFKLIEHEKARKFADNLEQLRRNAQTVNLERKKTYTIDVSCHEATEGKVLREIDGYGIYVYTPDMIVAEKLRALCQQMPEYSAIVKRSREGAPRGRDFFDIHQLCSLGDVDVQSPEFAITLQRIFAAKRVPLRLVASIPQHREKHRIDFDKLKDTVREGVNLQSYDFYFDYVVDLCGSLEALWVEDSPS